MFGTASSTVVRLDLRTMRTLSTHVQPTHLGPITTLCLDDRKRAWLLTGTSLGHLALWDLRFGLLLRTWRIGGGARVRSIVLHPVKGRGRCVLVAADFVDGTMLEIWDVEAVELVERFVRRSTDDEADAGGAAANGVVGQRDSSADAIAALLAHSVATGPVAPTAARCVVAGLDFATVGTRSTAATLHAPAELVEASSSTSATSAPAPRAYVITGSADRKLRYWDLERVEASVVFSGQDEDHDRIRYQCALVALCAADPTARRPMPGRSSTSSSSTRIASARAARIARASSRSISIRPFAPIATPSQPSPSSICPFAASSAAAATAPSTCTLSSRYCTTFADAHSTAAICISAPSLNLTVLTVGA